MKARTVREFLNLQRSRTHEWYRIVNKTDGPTQVAIYDEIGWMGLSAQDFIHDLREVNGPIDLHLNSPGGEVFDGIAIYNALRQRGDVRIVVDSLAASIASVIAMAADPGKLDMVRHSQMMIHDGFGMAVGNAADMRELADLLDRQSDNIASIYADRTGQPQGEWRDRMRSESWYTAEEAVQARLADRVITPTSNSALWSPDIRAASVDNSPWDGPAAMQRALHSNNPASSFRSICAAELTVGDPDQEAHWALPHHKEAGGPPNAKGVSSALGYFDRTKNMKNPSAARTHLENHEKEIQGGDGGGQGTSDHVHEDQFTAFTEQLKEVLAT